MTKTCPTDADLRDLLLGRGEATLGEHLLECPRCGAQAERLVASDPLLADLRAAHDTSELGSEGTFVEELLRRIQRPAAAPKKPDDELDFLDPPLPKHPDDLGMFSHYRIVEKIGQGGMGMVFRAVDANLERTVALKIILPKYAENQKLRDRFIEEARATVKVRSPHVAEIFETNVWRNVPYLTMELLVGTTLDKKPRPMALDALRRIGFSIAKGLADAHRSGLIHRDLKPSNIHLGTDSRTGKPTIKLIDFGLARPVNREIEITKSGELLGTPAYMSPEQARGKKVDHRTDLYSLGVILHQLATGKLPYDSADEGVMAILTELATPEPLTSVAQRTETLPPTLANLIDRLLAKDPANRPASADEVMKILKESLNEKAGSSTGTAVAESAPFVSVPDTTGAYEPSIAFSEMQTEPETRPAPTQARRWLWPAVGIGGALVALLLIVLGLGLLKVKTKDGTIIELADLPDDAEVMVDGEIVNVSWNEGKTKAEIRVKPGTRTVEVKKDGFRVTGEEITLAEGDRKPFTVRLEKLELGAKPAVPIAAVPTINIVESGELVVNGNADNRLKGWEIKDGRWSQFGPEARDPYFRPGVCKSALLQQDVDVSRFAADIDAGLVEFKFSGLISCYSRGQKDKARIAMIFLDGDRKEIDVAYNSGFVHEPIWREYGGTRKPVVGTRYVRIVLHSLRDRTPGNNENSGYYDNISLKALVTSPYGRELIVNGSGNDKDLTGWTNISGNWYSGDYYSRKVFCAGDCAFGVLQQDVSVARFAADIDAGRVSFQFRASLSSFDADTAQCLVQFLDESKKLLKTGYDTGAQANKNTWVPYVGNADAPVGTRTVRIELHSRRTPRPGNKQNSGYYDDLSLKAILAKPPTMVAKLPAAPPGSPLRYFGYTVTGTATNVARAVTNGNILIDRGWTYDNTAILDAARLSKRSVIVEFKQNNPPTDAEREQFFAFVEKHRDVIAGVSWDIPYFLKISPDSVGSFGRELKQKFPGLQFWVSIVEKPAGRFDPLPVPAEVDALQVVIYYDDTPEKVRVKSDDVLNHWLAKANGRPVLLRWTAIGKSDRPQGIVPQTQPGTMKAIVDIAKKYKLAGVVFDHYGDDDKGVKGIESNAALAKEIEDLGRELGGNAWLTGPNPPSWIDAAVPPAGGPNDRSRFNVRKGQWSIVGDELAQTDAGVDYALLEFGDENWTDYDYQVDLKRVQGGDQGALLFRWMSPSDFNLFGIGTAGNEFAVVEWQKDGKIGNLNSFNYHLNNNQWYTMLAKVRGDRITCELRHGPDKVRSWVADSDRMPRGKVGLRTVFSQYRFRNIKVTAPDGKVLWDGLPNIDGNQMPKTADFTNALGMKFARVPKGKAWVGGDANRVGDREVNMPDDFFMGIHEITQAEWQRVMGANPSHFSRTGEGKDAVKNLDDATIARFPVENVSWNDCQSFLTKLNEQAKETGWTYRLPTGAEWEYACRGGPMADIAESRSNFYLAGPINTLTGQQGNYRVTGLGRTCPVGSFPPNKIGLYDLHGNVWEFLHNTPSAETCQSFGNSWNNETHEIRSALSTPVVRSAVGSNMGLRVVRVPVTQPTDGPTFTNALGMKFARVPKGTVPLGGRDGKPGTRNATVAADFYLGTYEVTQQQWQDVMGANPASIMRSAGGQDLSAEAQKTFAVNAVTWHEAREFAKKLNERLKEPGWEYRLPTEAEWEYACRGGPGQPQSAYGFKYYAGEPSNTLAADQANFGDRLKNPCPVGKYQANKLGLYDMHGNVGEWCDDVHMPPLRDASGKEARVNRGGSHWESASYCDINWQSRWTPDGRHRHVGLRIARVPVPGFVPSAPKANARTVDLLALVDVDRDAVKGTWTRGPDGITSENSAYCRIKFPHQPLPAEYDYRVEFTAKGGGNDVLQLLSAGGNGFSFLMGAWGGKWDGFDAVTGHPLTRAGTDIIGGPTSIKRNTRHTSVISVRKDSISATIDGKLVVKHTTKFTDLRMPNEWKIGDGFLGLGTTFDPTTFHVAELVDVNAVAAAAPAPMSAPTPAATPNGFTSLFNGQDRTGWMVEGGDANQWTVENGAIVGRSKDYKSRGHFLTEKQYTDFTLRFEFQVGDAQSHGAVDLRAEYGEKVPMTNTTQIPDHPLIKLTNPTHDSRDATGAAHWLKSSVPYVLPTNAPKVVVGQWHTVEVTVKGDTCTASFDGVACVDLKLDPAAARPFNFEPGLLRKSGRVGFQINTGTMRYRNVSIRELKTDAVPALRPDAKFAPLFNGKDLTGWESVGNANAIWKVENGELVGSWKNSDFVGGNTLATKRKDYRNFRLRVTTQPSENWASRIYGLPGINPSGTGGFFKVWIGTEKGEVGGEMGRLTLRATDDAPLLARAKVAPKAWNVVEVVVQGNRIQVLVDGVKTADQTDDRMPAAGHAIGLHLTGGSALRIKSVEIEELPPTAAAAPPATEPTFIPLFNGKDIKDWKRFGNPKGEWKIENGILKGTSPLSNYWWGAELYREEMNYRQFHIRLEAQPSQGWPSRLSICNEITPGKSNPQFKVWLGPGTKGGEREIGRVWYPLARNPNAVTTLVNPPPDIKAGEWFTMDIVYRNEHLTVDVNRVRVTDLKNVPVSPAKRYPLVVDCADGGSMAYRKIEIRELK